MAVLQRHRQQAPQDMQAALAEQAGVDDPSAPPTDVAPHVLDALPPEEQKLMNALAASREASGFSYLRPLVYCYRQDD